METIIYHVKPTITGWIGVREALPLLSISGVKKDMVLQAITEHAHEHNNSVVIVYDEDDNVEVEKHYSKIAIQQLESNNLLYA